MWLSRKFIVAHISLFEGLVPWPEKEISSWTQFETYTKKHDMLRTSWYQNSTPTVLYHVPTLMFITSFLHFHLQVISLLVLETIHHLSYLHIQMIGRANESTSKGICGAKSVFWPVAARLGWRDIWVSRRIQERLHRQGLRVKSRMAQLRLGIWQDSYWRYHSYWRYPSGQCLFRRRWYVWFFPW